MGSKTVLSRNSILGLILGVSIYSNSATNVENNYEEDLDVGTATQLVNGIVLQVNPFKNWLVKEVINGTTELSYLDDDQVSQLENEIEYLKRKIDSQKASVVMSVE